MSASIPAPMSSSTYYATPGSPMLTNPSNVINTSMGYIDQQAARVANAAVNPASRSHGLWNLVIMFVVIALVIMVVVWILRLPIGMQTGPGGVVTNMPSFAKILGTGIFGSLIIIFLIWIISKIRGR